MWQSENDPADICTFQYVRIKRPSDARAGRYSMLRICTRAGLRVRRAWKLLRKNVLTETELKKMDGFWMKAESDAFAGFQSIIF